MMQEVVSTCMVTIKHKKDVKLDYPEHLNYLGPTTVYLPVKVISAPDYSLLPCDVLLDDSFHHPDLCITRSLPMPAPKEVLLSGNAKVCMGEGRIEEVGFALVLAGTAI